MVTKKILPFAILTLLAGCVNAERGRENTQDYINGFRPTLLQYATSSLVIAEGETITPQIPEIVAKLAITSCSSTPALPTGLTLDTTNCRISGTPTTAQSATTYLITAANALGSVSAQLQIRITTPPPSNLVYTGSPFAFVKTAPITTITPTVTGVVTSCTASPALPGLTLDNTTCAISGAPTTSQLQTTHTITAANADGSTSTTIDLTIFRVLFVTQNSTQGNVIANSGVADNFCNSDANRPANTGSYKAMIVGWGTRRACLIGNCATSGAGENLDWVLVPNTQYRRNDLATQIQTTNSAGIFTFPLAAALVASASGGTGYWTGMTTVWTTNGTGTCGGNWSTALSTGAAGVITVTSSNAIFLTPVVGNCNSTNAFLACAQQ